MAVEIYSEIFILFYINNVLVANIVFFFLRSKVYSFWGDFGFQIWYTFFQTFFFFFFS